jgi:hypothetical protein
MLASFGVGGGPGILDRLDRQPHRRVRIRGHRLHRLEVVARRERARVGLERERLRPFSPGPSSTSKLPSLLTSNCVSLSAPATRFG